MSGNKDQNVAYHVVEDECCFGEYNISTSLKNGLHAKFDKHNSIDRNKDWNKNSETYQRD